MFTGFLFSSSLTDLNEPRWFDLLMRLEEPVIEMPAPFHASNVMLIDSKTGKPTRVRTRVDKDGTKERIGVKSGEVIPRAR